MKKIATIFVKAIELKFGFKNVISYFSILTSRTNRTKELEHFTEIIAQNFPTVLVNSFTNLQDLQKQLSNEIVMAPDYIFLEDQSIDSETYYMLRKFFKLDKASGARIVVFGPNVQNIMKRRSGAFKWKILEIKEYDTIDLEKIITDIKQLFGE